MASPDIDQNVGEESRLPVENLLEYSIPLDFMPFSGVTRHGARHRDRYKGRVLVKDASNRTADIRIAEKSDTQQFFDINIRGTDGEVDLYLRDKEGKKYEAGRPSFIALKKFDGNTRYDIYRNPVEWFLVQGLRRTKTTYFSPEETFDGWTLAVRAKTSKSKPS